MMHAIFSNVCKNIDSIRKLTLFKFATFALFTIFIQSNSSKADTGIEFSLKIQNQEKYIVYINDIDEKYVESISTNTPWHDDIAKYTGILIQNFLEQYENGEFSEISISAMNGYTVDADIRTFVNAGAMLVWLMNDAPISVHNKGPIVVIFPWSQNGSLREDIFTSLAVWHVNSIHIR